MTQTNMDVLAVACRNRRGLDWILRFTASRGFCTIFFMHRAALETIRTEYHRLMRLKARKKRWRS